MGVYIKGMWMPTSCYECNCFINDSDGSDYCCLLMQDIEDNDKRDDNCPLVLVPDHGRLIDADALEKEAQKRMLICSKNDNQFQQPYEIMRAIALAPTVIPAEPCKEKGE